MKSHEPFAIPSTCKSDVFKSRSHRLAIGSMASAFALALAVSATPALALSANKADQVGIDPYYTGSLLAPSPALSRQGLYAFEPYVIETISPNRYGIGGGLTPVSDVSSTTSTFIAAEYAFTNRFTLQIDPQTQINQDSKGFNSGSQIGDLPIDLKYRLINQNNDTGAPSLTFSSGVDVPTGRYQNLYSGFDGQGNGNVRVRLGLLAQSLLFAYSPHPIRIRAYVTGAVPVGEVGVHNISVFGTGEGFNGTGYSGLSGSIGVSFEYSITQRLVFANDLIYQASRSSTAFGFDGTTPVDLRSGTSDNLMLAPAFEYNFNAEFGIIAGVAFSVEGHNSSQIVQPTIAFNFVLDTTKPMSGFPALFKDLPGSGGFLKY